jgi:hypothetical protein
MMSLFPNEDILAKESSHGKITNGRRQTIVYENVNDCYKYAAWLQWMRNSFRKGTVTETWKQVEPDRRFNPAFQNFINTEIIGANLLT